MLKRNFQPQEGDVRLFGLPVNSAGRVEVFHDGTWGTVCDDNWDMTEAQVVCRQLNFPGAKSVVTGQQYGQAPGPIWLDDISCKGTENHLVSCNFKLWGETDCTHKEDVGVICETGSNVTARDSAHALDHSISLSDNLGRIFDSGNSCDFLILVQSPSGDRQDNGTLETLEPKVCAHKMILSQFPLFNTSKGISNITVNVSPSCQPYFTSFIRYIYTRKIDVTYSSALCLHWMASHFGVKQLMDDVGRMFAKILPEDTSFHSQISLYKYAVETEDVLLMENCIHFLAWNYQNLTRSPAWTTLSVELLEALLSSSDLVVPDEYFVLHTLEGWITAQDNAISLETQAKLLSHIRFPMIPVEKLYELESDSPLYGAHKNMYREKEMKAFQFNILLFSNLVTSPKFNKDDADYHPRIYTAEPWSTVVDPSIKQPLHQVPIRYSLNNKRVRGYYHAYPTVIPYPQAMSFRTPVHNSLIFKDNKINWNAKVLQSQNECSREGLRCESLPVAWLALQNHNTPQSNIFFRNRLLVMCQGSYVCQVQGFKGDLAAITMNGTQVVACPCPNDQYTYRFVVRPEYI